MTGRPRSEQAVPELDWLEESSEIEIGRKKIRWTIAVVVLKQEGRYLGQCYQTVLQFAGTNLGEALVQQHEIVCPWPILFCN